MALHVRLVKQSDGEELPVPVGETQIGRGPFLKVTDKRVSRLHATLRLEDGRLALCPKHKNPCFYKAAGQSKFTTLPKDQWRDLSSGDSFSLLPDDLVFRVVCESCQTEQGANSTGDIRPVTTVSGDPLDVLFSTTKASETTPRTDRESPPMETDSSVRDKAPPDTEKEPPSLADTTARTDSVPESTLRVEEGTEDGEVKPKLTTSLSGSTGRQRTLPSWLSGLASEGSREPPAARKRKAPKASVSKRKVEEDEEIAPPPTKKVSKRAAPAKATTHTDSDDSKPSSLEDKAAPGGKGDSKPLDKAAAGGKGEDKELKDKSTASRGDTKTKKGRKDSGKSDGDKPPCPYGARCYRKNPAHFKEYSHDSSPPASAPASVPDSVDSLDSVGDDDSDKPICPYGRDCYRKNPAHRRDYRHLDEPAKKGDAGKRRSKRTTKGKRSTLSGDSDDDGEPNTYDYNDSFIDDEQDGGESSSYGDSEDSDWSPGVKDDSENVGELVAEAKDFMSNKKMRRTT